MSLDNGTAKANKPKKKKYCNFYYDFVKVTGALPMLLWFRPRVLRPFGRPKMKGALISANHPTMLDPITVHLAFPSRRLSCLATKDLYRTPLLRWFFPRMQCIEVDKQNFALSSFHEVVDRLSEGRCVVIFPEGGLHHEEDGKISPFKSGVILMAHKSHAPIIPVYIVKRTSKWQRQTVVVGEAVDISAHLSRLPNIKELEAASEYLRRRELELCEYAEAYFSRKRKHKNEKENSL